MVEIDQCGQWPTQTSTWLYFTLPRQNTWAAASGHVGGAELTALEACVEMENYNFEAGALDVVAATMAVDLATAFARVQRMVDHSTVYPHPCTSLFLFLLHTD